MSSEQDKIDRRTAYILKRVKDLIELGRSTFYVEEYRAGIAETDILGVIVAKYCEWTPKEILEVVSSALEEANLHTLNGQVDALVSRTPEQIKKLAHVIIEQVEGFMRYAHPQIDIYAGKREKPLVSTDSELEENIIKTLSQNSHLL